VLPLLTSRCFVAISASGIALVQAPAFGQRVYDKKYYPFDGQLNKTPSSFYPLLNTVFANHSRQKSQQLQVILSADFIRFMVLPSQSNALNGSDRLAFARAIYQDVYGVLSDSWVIEADDAPPKQSILCAAIDQILLEQLNSMAIEHRFTLSSVVPYATKLINQFNLKGYDGYLAVVEPTRLVLVNFKGGLQNLHHIKWENDWVSPLKILLNQTILRNGLSTKHLMIYAPMNTKLDEAKFTDFNVKFLTPIPSVLQSADFQMLRGCV